MSRRTPRILAATLAVAALALGACASKTDDQPAAGGSSATAAFPVTVGAVTLDKRPEKIVSLSASATEMIFAVGAGPQVVAVDDNSNYPAEAPKTDLSGFQPNAEAIAAKNPDLVVISDDRNKIVDQLGKLKIPVYITPAAKTLDDSYRQITDLGALTGHTAEAADVTKRMRDDIAKLVKDLPQRSKKLTYYHELGPELYSATSKTFIGSLYTMAGLENIADPADADGSNGGYPQLSQEVIVKANPDFVFLADTKCCQQSAETVKARSGWAGITAVKNNQVVALDDDIASRWGPRVVDLLRAIVDAVAKVPA
ncbi:ABC transporter substrate-binding protein [Micromonospora krabiensis]|uniref:Iron complex transport system substrate-binding protein n=1 Tax=Micromonospora krabiensis TaxID=307121 RepID=A0A1C3N7Q8_9ACTN|nr:ABC transporter substrate-binding protein [Micromonospora krabiensis]SBV28586.1 iron complex transport system substrate-binding protein [Micromonospora krabiensis]